MNTKKLIEKLEVSDELLKQNLEWMITKDNYGLHDYGNLVKYLLKKVSELESKLKTLKPQPHDNTRN